MTVGVVKAKAVQGAWFEVNSASEQEQIESNLHDNDPPRRVRGVLHVDARGAPYGLPTFDNWMNERATAGLAFLVEDHSSLVMLGFRWSEARAANNAASRDLLRSLEVEAWEEWVEHATKTIQEGEDPYWVETALLERWHGRRCGMTERDGQPIIPNLDVVRASPWFVQPPVGNGDVAMHADGWTISEGDDDYLFVWHADNR